MVYSGVALSGGGARATFGSCGAYSGGFMTLSAKLPPRSPEPSTDPTTEQLAELEKAKGRFHIFRDWFAREFGSVSCSLILKKLFGGNYILSDENSRKDLEKVQEKLGFNCHVVTTRTIAKVLEMLNLDNS